MPSTSIMRLLASGLALNLIPACSANSQGANQTLVPWTFTPLPLGSVKPGGWLLNEMQASANGLAGHEADFYEFVADSRWLHAPGSNAGTDYSALNEALPYWLNGLVPLAYGLDDDRLIAQVKNVTDIVLGFQATDGWLGPEVGDGRNLWARSPLLLALTQLAEADTDYEERIVKSMRSFLNLTHSMLSDGGKGFTDCGTGIDCSWGQVRYHDLIISIQWLLEKYPDSQHDAVLWDTMNMLFDQTLFRWDAWYNGAIYQKVVSDPTTNNPLFAFLHGVNVGQGLKSLEVIRRFTHNDSLLQSTKDAIQWTFQYHGAPSGTVLADEIMRDLASYSGSELCTAVETAFSLEYLYQSMGINEYADRAERAIFNALPVMLTGDHWAHQYMDQPNGPWTNSSASGSNAPPVFTTSAFGVATIFGLEPQYPCCTVNHPQGYPKFLANSWSTLGSSGLVHSLLSPSTVSTTLDAGQVTVKCDTGYPFGNSFTYTTSANSSFDLYLRVPTWATSKAVTVDGKQMLQGTADASSSLVQITLSGGQHTILLDLAADVRYENRTSGAVSVYVGNVLFGLDINPIESLSTSPHRFNDAGGAPATNVPFSEARDYYFIGKGDWAVAIDPTTLTYHAPVSSPDTPFVPGTDAGYVSVLGCPCEWALHLNVTPDVPPSNATCSGPQSTYKLLPYGQVKVHMSELPVVHLNRTAVRTGRVSKASKEVYEEAKPVTVWTRIAHMLSSIWVSVSGSGDETRDATGYMKSQ